MTAYNRVLISLSLAGCLTGTQLAGQTKNGNTSRPADTTGAVRQPQTSPAAQGNRDVSVQGSASIIRKVTEDKNLSTLLSAIRQTDLEATLSNPGPFTVFAPTDEAFRALPSGTLSTLMKDQSKERLSSILRFHVVPGRIRMADLEDGQKLKTVNGEELSVTKLNGKVAINGAELDQPDLDASNGVIHVLGKVLLPPHMGMVGNKK